MDRIAKIIRYATVAPIMALAALLTLLFAKPEVYGGTASFVCAVLFLTVTPLLAYPLQRFCPHFKDKGRDGQRSLAMIFAVAGYILGFAANFIVGSKSDIGAISAMQIIYLEYLLSGACIFIFNKCFHLKASGHACGVVGPAALLIYFGLYPAAIIGAVVTALVFWASLRSKRHTARQLIGGMLIPIAVICVLGAAAALMAG